MIKKFIKEKGFLVGVILVAIVAGICLAVWGFQQRSPRKKKTQEVYTELTLYNGMQVRGKSRAGGKGEEERYCLIIKDPKINETVSVTVTEDAFKRYDIDDTINEVVANVPDDVKDLIPQYLTDEGLACNGREVVTEGNHDYVVQYTVMPVYKDGEDPKFIKVYTGICHYEDCRFCTAH